MNDFEQTAMRGVMNGFNQGEETEIMEGKVKDPKYKRAEGWRKMQQVFRVTDPPIVIHYFENANTGEREQFHFVSKPAYYDPRYWQ